MSVPCPPPNDGRFAGTCVVQQDPRLRNVADDVYEQRRLQSFVFVRINVN
jgi:hypothetical protein